MAPRIHKDTGWRLFLRAVMGRSYSRAVGYQRQWSRLLIEVGLPLIALIAYVFVYRSIGAPEDLIGYVVLGGAMSWFWVNVIWGMATQFFWERQIGNLALYIMAPTSVMAILLGMALGGIVLAGVRAGLIIIIGSTLFHIQYSVTSVPLLCLVFLLTLTALYAMGMTSASFFLLFGREARYFIDMTQEPVFLASGTYFPIRSLNFWIAAAASLIPLTLGLDAMRQMVFAKTASLGFLSPKVESAVLAGLVVVFMATAQFSLKHMERLAVEEGKLMEDRA